MNEQLLTGRDASAMVPVPVRSVGDGQRSQPILLQAAAADAFARLAADARALGFELSIASGYRSFERQLAIFNAKACGERPVLDHEDRPIDLESLDTNARIDAILRYSALPGGSRHHWGTEVDVFDASCLPPDYRVALSEAEVAPGGLFDPLHCWLDERIAAGRSHGFYRPYDVDRGGVAPERWHLSFAPLAQHYERLVDADVLQRCWNESCADALCWREALQARLPDLVERYLRAVSPPSTQCAGG